MFNKVLAFAFITATLTQVAGQEGKDAKEPKVGNDARHEEVVQKLLENIGQITKSLESITDADSAKDARPALRNLAAEFLRTRKDSENLPPPPLEVRERIAKEYRPKLESARKELVAQMARVQRVEGGPLALQEIRGVFEKKAQ